MSQITSICSYVHIETFLPTRKERRVRRCPTDRRRARMRTHGRLTSHDSSPLSPRAHTTRGGGGWMPTWIDDGSSGSTARRRRRRRRRRMDGWMDRRIESIDRWTRMRWMDGSHVADAPPNRFGRRPHPDDSRRASAIAGARARCVCVCVCVCVFLRVMYAYSSVYSVVVWDDD